MRTQTPYKRFGFRISPAHGQALRKVAKAQKVSLTDVIERAIELVAAEHQQARDEEAGVKTLERAARG